MDSEAVGEYVEQSHSLLEASPQMDEENTKVKLIQPFVDLLGWNFYSTEVQLEYTVQMGTRSSKVDYALTVGDTPVVFIEAKPARSELSDGNVRQLQSYMRQELSVDWGVLTNGKEFEILSVTGDHRQNGETSIATFDLDEMADNPDILEILTKDAIQSGRAGDIARQLTQTNRAISRLTDRETPVAERLTDVLQDELDETPLDLEEQSLDFVNELRHTLREQREFMGESTDDGDDTSDDNVSEDDPGTEEGEIEPVENTVAGTMRRADIEAGEEAQVAVFPTRKSGLTFLYENNAWGFVQIGRTPDYVAMYLSQDVQEVRYVAKVDGIVSPEAAQFHRKPESYVDRAEIEDGKMVIEFVEDSLYELKDPIPFDNEYPQSLRYTTVEKLRTAETTDDLFADTATQRAEPNSMEALVLDAVRENPGSPLRSLHRTVAEFDESRIEWVDEWGKSRTTVQTALQELREMELVRLEDRSWYPADSDNV